MVSAACDDVADGFASLNGGTAGGRGGTEVTVTTLNDLQRDTITVSPAGEELRVSSNKTIIGLGSNAAISMGGFGIHGVKNVIIRNLRITNPGDPDTSDHDGIQADTSSNIWIDHCHFESGGDGLVDLRKDTTFWTVSNTIFRNHDKAFGIGWTNNVVAQGTIHHSLFDRTNQRNPSADNLLHAHMYNNYMTGVTSYGHYVRGSTNARIENVYFHNTSNPVTVDAEGTVTCRGNIYNGTTGDSVENQGTSFDPTKYYHYTLDPTEDVPSIVQANAGPKASVCS
ncbi:polysaccharide lyase family 1 protein [Stachybotrys elegans]|uniref:Polysaccharide lyase family 1 protein n=1 Tax=Stachybotrys elegans TaxID=80388 RepID=A0A8K0SPJ2_9HYPO|nr:polysaccharide lyase family 1 protein [Stachybotrys elegans]